MPPAKYPGATNGNVTVRNTRHALAPRFSADSRNVGSTFAIAADKFRNMIGYRFSVCNSITPQNPPAPSQSTCVPNSRFTDPYRARNCRIPIAPTNGGMIIGTSNSALSTVLPRKAYRVNTCANGNANNVVNAVTATASRKLLNSAPRINGLCNANRKKSKVHRPSTTKAPRKM